jgi:hypothetical protein
MNGMIELDVKNHKVTMTVGGVEWRKNEEIGDGNI